MANQTIKLTATQLKRIDRLAAALEKLSNELFLEGDPLDRQIYELLFKLQMLKANGSNTMEVALSALQLLQ